MIVQVQAINCCVIIETHKVLSYVSVTVMTLYFMFSLNFVMLFKDLLCPVTLKPSFKYDNKCRQSITFITNSDFSLFNIQSS